MERLAFLAANAKDEKVRLSATVQLVAYIHGKPKEQLQLSTSVTYYDAVAKARARVLQFEQAKSAAGTQTVPVTIDAPAEPTSAPTFSEWKEQNGLHPTAPDSEETPRPRSRISVS